MYELRIMYFIFDINIAYSSNNNTDTRILANTDNLQH